MTPLIKETAKLLPYSARDQLIRYLEFVRERAIDVAFELDIYPLEKERLVQIDLLFFARFLWNHYNQGFTNFSTILRTLEKYDVSGFQIGSQVFDRDSQLVNDWRALARAIRDLISDFGLNDLVMSSESHDSILRSFLQGRTQ